MARGEGDAESSSDSLCQLGVGIAYFHAYLSVPHSTTMASPKLQCRFNQLKRIRTSKELDRVSYLVHFVGLSVQVNNLTMVFR